MFPGLLKKRPDDGKPGNSFSLTASLKEEEMLIAVLMLSGGGETLIETRGVVKRFPRLLIFD